MNTVQVQTQSGNKLIQQYNERKPKKVVDDETTDTLNHSKSKSVPVTEPIESKPRSDSFDLAMQPHFITLPDTLAGIYICFSIYTTTHYIHIETSCLCRCVEWRHVVGVEYLFVKRIRGSFGNLSESICNRLLTALLYHVGGSDASKSKRTKIASNTAKHSLKLIALFSEHVTEFQTTLIERDAFVLREKLKLHQHMDTNDFDHQKIVVRFLLFLTNFAPFANWR